MIVIAFDPGTAIVGYGVIKYEETKMEVLDYGCIFTHKDDPMQKRLAKIFNEADALIKLYKPDTIAIEDIFYFKNNKTVISVGQARGVLLVLCELNGVSGYGYTPLQVKQGITSYGRADKKQVQEMVTKILGLKEIPKPDDAADALALAVTHINTITSGLGGSTGTGIKKIKLPKDNKITLDEYKKMIKGK